MNSNLENLEGEKSFPLTRATIVARVPPFYRALPEPDHLENLRPQHRCGAARRLRLTPPLSSHSASVSGARIKKNQRALRGIAIR